MGHCIVGANDRYSLIGNATSFESGLHDPCCDERWCGNAACYDFFVHVQQSGLFIDNRDQLGHHQGDSVC